MERLDNYVPPSERKKAVRTPVPKRPASPFSMAGNSTGSPPAKRAASSSTRVSTAACVKREKTDSRPKLLKSAPKIIFGIDFGTTFSGIAFAWSDQIDKITVLMDIDDSNEENPKVASAIDTNSKGPDGRHQWGNAAKGKEGSLEWFKLLLVDEDDLPQEVRNSEHVQQARSRLNDLKNTPEEVVSIYLEGMWEQCLAKVKAEVSQTTVDLSRFHIVITLPAIWQDYARNRMREAANHAGLLEKRPGVGDTMISFVSEPEAAALATLKTADGRCDIQVDDSFVVCDCGGGTVDLISYQVSSTEPMVVKEIVKGAGALCGAVFVDDRFKTLLKIKIDEVSPNAWSLVTNEEIQEIMTNDWQKIRGQFKGGVQEWTIRYPYSLINHEGCVKVGAGFPKFKITSDEVKQVFAPIVQKIKYLVNGQADAVLEKENKSPKYIVLVGGFGRCKYLYGYLKKHCNGVEILQCQGAEPWTAICRGAVIHGMTVEKMDSKFAVGVRSRIARASYGIICQEKWDETEHSEEDKFWDEDQQIWTSRTQMKWLITEGQDVMVDRKFRHNFYKLLDEQPQALYTTIWSSKASPPPSRKDASVTKHCDVKWNLKVDRAKLPVFINNEGQSFSQLDFATEMKCSGGSTEFVVLHNGRRQAAKNVKVEFHDH